MKTELILGDCLEKMKEIETGSVDAIVTDPPYGLSFMGKDWDKGVPGVHFWEEMLRVLKPGGHLLSFAGTRTQHRMAVNIEDAGFEIRDMIAWVYGSGFPKSLDVSKAIDKARDDKQSVAHVAEQMLHARKKSGKARSEIDAHFATANVSQYWFSPHRNAQIVPADKWPWVREWLGIGGELDAEVWRLNGRKGKPGENWEKREVVGQKTAGMGSGETFGMLQAEGRNGDAVKVVDITAPATEAARQWAGWGTALKPALEPITVARKPFQTTVAANVLEHGTGALNVDGCRVAIDEAVDDPLLGGKGTWSSEKMAKNVYEGGYAGERVGSSKLGRWPANLIHDGSDEVVGLFPVTGGGGKPQQRDRAASAVPYTGSHRPEYTPYKDTATGGGSAARFFYCAKASKKDRCADNKHPTVKPTDLMRYLCRLVTPPGGTVLDPFMGSGSTGKAAVMEGFKFIGIEKDEAYFEIAKSRIESAK